MSKWQERTIEERLEHLCDALPSHIEIDEIVRGRLLGALELVERDARERAARYLEKRAEAMNSRPMERVLRQEAAAIRRGS